MVRDRLKELQLNQNHHIENDEGEQFIVRIGDTGADLDGIFKMVEDINGYIDKMNPLVDEMKKIHASMLSAPVVEEKTKQILEDININFKLLSKKTKEDLKGIQTEIIDLETKNETHSAAYRIRSTQYSMLQQKVMDVITRYNITQVEYREKCKERLKRQLEITGRSTTSEELDEMIENPNPEIFIQGMITQTKIAKQQLEEIEARHADIIKIEKSIRELHEMFMDMAMLVEQQGDIINRIETHVQNTYDYVEKGREQTKIAVDYQRKSRKLKIIIILILIFILVMILISIFGF